MANMKILFLLITLVTVTSGAAYFRYPEDFPIVYLQDFKYFPTDNGYVLMYKTNTGITHEEIGIVNQALLENSPDSNPDTLGSQKTRQGSTLPFKSRKVSPKLLSSLAG